MLEPEGEPAAALVPGGLGEAGDEEVAFAEPGQQVVPAGRHHDSVRDGGGEAGEDWFLLRGMLAQRVLAPALVHLVELVQGQAVEGAGRLIDLVEPAAAEAGSHPGDQSQGDQLVEAFVEDLGRDPQLGAQRRVFQIDLPATGSTTEVLVSKS